MEAYYPELMALAQIIMVDVVLAGDNAIIVGLAASRVAPEIRARVVFWGIAGAVILRILFAAITTQLLAIVGLTLSGGILLLWVCWKMYREISRGGHGEDPKPHSLGASAASEQNTEVRTMSFWAAITQIVVADVSMSLDNVLAVAGVAKGQTWILVVGLAIAVVLMAVAATYIANLLAKYPWITWLGLAVIVYVAIDMIWVGGLEVGCQFVSPQTCKSGALETFRYLGSMAWK